MSTGRKGKIPLTKSKHLQISIQSPMRFRLCWLIVVSMSAYFSATICTDQWQRYRNNPILMQMESNHRKWSYDVVGVTLCPLFVDDRAIDALIDVYWNISRDTSPMEFQYYDSYLRTIATVDLRAFRAFADDASLNRVDMEFVAMRVCTKQDMR